MARRLRVLPRRADLRRHQRGAAQPRRRARARAAASMSAMTRMRLRPDDDAVEFAGAVRELLDRACDGEALRAAWDSDDGRVPGLWKRLAENGVTGLTVPEAQGGTGLDVTAAVPLLIKAGRAAVPEPLIETMAG